jgi:hypothetical protein
MDWDYGQRYNASGKFNPRLIACDNCGEYLEPEEFIPDNELCKQCNLEIMGVK